MKKKCLPLQVPPLVISSTSPSNATSSPPKLSFCHSGTKNLIAYKGAIYNAERTAKTSALSSLLPLVNLAKDANHASFFYCDKFLVHGNGNSIVLSQYDTTRGASRTVWSHAIEGSLRITDLACLNAPRSHLVFVSNSDRSMRVLDVAIGSEYWSVPNASGRRQAHSIALPPASPNSPVPPDAYNLVGAASHDQGGLITLWDVRTASPAATLTGHTNRRDLCRINFSPCMRYLSTGTEDATGGAIYDLRKGEIKGRIAEGRKLKDGTVTEVAWNPIFPQLATATNEGVVRFYSAGE